MVSGPGRGVRVVGGGPDVDTIDGGGARVRGSVAAVALPLVKKLALSQ